MNRMIICFALATLMTGNVLADKKEKHPIYGQAMKSLAGKSVEFSKFKGKVLLIVNTASACGATPQYGPLQQLQEKYKKQGLVVMGFPCNQFGRQEPGSDSQIAEFCKSSYGVSFEMFSKIDVNGEKSAPIFKFLTSDKAGVKDAGAVRWNFEKFLISRDGKVAGRYRTSKEPDSKEVVTAIEQALAEKATNEK